MNKEESIQFSREVHDHFRRVRYGDGINRYYPHPRFNTPIITIRVRRSGGAFVVRGSANGRLRYESTVRRGQRLDTRLRTAFRETASSATAEILRQ